MARKEAPVRVKLNATVTWERMALHNFSQNELARRLGITSGYLSQLVNGQRCPSPSLRRRLLESLPGSSFEDLFVVERRNGHENPANLLVKQHNVEGLRL